MILIIFAIFCSQISFQSAHRISVFGDVYKDSDFFITTLPWIVDNIGGEISIDFYMVGSGRYAIPQMCALDQMKFNTYLQAQYLKCEAEGYPSELCLCESGIDRAEFKQCVVNGGNLSSLAAAKFTQVRVEHTPLIELAYGSTVFGVEDAWYLKKICTIFGDNLPRGCVKPFACENGLSQGEFRKRAVAHFDHCCRRQWASCSDGYDLGDVSNSANIAITGLSPDYETTFSS